jgi:hypothetical protein
MSSCEGVRQGLGAYVLGGLDEDETEAVAAHAAECPRCRGELEELAETAELLAVLREPIRRAPADLKRRVLGDARPSRRWAGWLVAAAIVLAAFAGAGVARTLDGSTPPDTVFALRGVAPSGIDGEAGLSQLPSGVRVELDLAGVRPSDEGYYHGWLHRGDRRVSAGTFVGTDEQEAQVQLFCGGELADYDRLTVTWHPFGEDTEVLALDADV